MHMLQRKMKENPISFGDKTKANPDINYKADAPHAKCFHRHAGG